MNNSPDDRYYALCKVIGALEVTLGNIAARGGTDPLVTLWATNALALMKLELPWLYGNRGKQS